MPTKQGVFFIGAALFCYLAAVVFEVSAFMYVTGIVLTLLGLDFVWLRVSCFGVGCRLKVDRRAKVGEHVRLRFDVQNSWPVPRYGLALSVRFPASGPPVRTESVWVPALSSYSSAQHTILARCDRRGKFTIGPFHLTYEGPLGLFYQSRAFNDGNQLEVQPPCVRLEGFPLLQSGEGLVGSERRKPKPGHGSEFYAVRPYMSGDSPRWIHWLSTLRAQKLMTRQFQAVTQKRAVVVLDCSTGRFNLNKDGDDFETAVVCAASLARTAFETDHEVGLLLAGLGGWIAPAPGVENLRHILSVLADVSQSAGASAEPDFRKLNGRLESVVFVTPDPDQGSANLLVQMRSGNRQVRAVLVDSSDGRPSRRFRGVRDFLRRSGIPVDRVRGVDTMKQELERPVRPEISGQAQAVSRADSIPESAIHAGT